MIGWLTGRLMTAAGPWMLGGVAAAVAVLLLALGAQTVRLADLRTDVADLKREHADQLRDQATAAASAAESRRLDYEARVADMSALLDQHQRGMDDAREKAENLAADLRAERTVRVRRALCPSSAVPGPESAAAPGVDGEPALDGAGIAAAAIGAGAQADVRLATCVGIARRDRERRP